MPTLYDYDKNEIKNNLDTPQMMDYLSELGAEPIDMGNDIIHCKTICHCGDSHKLYYYANTHLFKCFTGCNDAFDVFDLTKKVLGKDNDTYQLPQAVKHVADFFGYSPNQRISKDDFESIDEWKILNNYSRIANIKPKTQEVELKEYDDTILSRLPHPKIQPWMKENISEEVMNKYNICYDPKSQGIVIPHYDKDNRLIGIRERALVEEIANKYGKYRPANINGVLYNHPLSFNLYGLNFAKDNIKTFKKAIVFESEKAVLQYESLFPQSIAVACCGSALINYQVELLRQFGVEEIIVAFDHDFDDLEDESAQKQIKNLTNIYHKYGNKITISFIWDKENFTEYKASPIEASKDIFLYLYSERINLYD